MDIVQLHLKLLQFVELLLEQFVFALESRVAIDAGRVQRGRDALVVFRATVKHGLVVIAHAHG